MDARNYSTVAKWLAVIMLTAWLLASLPAANAETEPVSPIPTDWIPAPDPCSGKTRLMVRFSSGSAIQLAIQP